MKTKIMGLMGAMLMASAPAVAATTKVYKCFSPEEMEKPRKERISEVGFARLRDGKNLDYAVMVNTDIISEVGTLDKGVYQLTQNTSDQTSFAADVSIQAELSTELIVTTKARQAHRIEEIVLSIAEGNGNTIISKNYECSTDTRFSRYARKFTRAYEEIRDEELKDIESILVNAATIVEAYKDLKANTELKKRQYIELKDKRPFSKVKVDVIGYDESGIALTEDQSLVGCIAADARMSWSKGGGVIDRVECLRPNFTVKKRKKAKKRKKFRFRRISHSSSGQSTEHIGCPPVTRSSFRRGISLPKIKIGFKRGPRLVRLRASRGGKK